jgi:hypothetical protein
VLARVFAREIEAGRLTVVEGDAMGADWASLLARGPRPRALAGNLPYLLTGVIGPVVDVEFGPLARRSPEDFDRGGSRPPLDRLLVMRLKW